MTHVADGQAAEQAAAEYIERLGYKVLARNWRTRLCEIDIVARKGAAIYFCEVKYRRTGFQGAGLDYITPKKLQQMRFAAESWVHRYSWRGEYRLGALEVSGLRYEVTAFVEDIDQ